MGVGKRRARSWQHPVGPAAGDLPPERRYIRCLAGEDPDPGQVAMLVALGFTHVRVSPVGWHGIPVEFDHWYERRRPATPPRPICRRK
jgi:hypothetical protein